MQHFTDIEARLATPDRIAILEQMLQSLQAAESRIRADAKRGLSPSAFKANNALTDAFLAAQDVLRNEFDATPRTITNIPANGGLPWK